MRSNMFLAYLFYPLKKLRVCYLHPEIGFL